VSSVAFTNIKTLVTNDVSHDNGALGALNGASVVVEDGLIRQISKSVPSGVDRVIDCTGMTLLPGFVDSHSHLIFAGDRSAEFAARSHGQEYTAGGISTTVAATRIASDAQLTENAHNLLDEALLSGTTTIEIKSGYGLTEKDELRSIEIAGQFTDETTLLAAHVIPAEFTTNPDGYVELVVESIIPKSRAKWIDVFCDEGAFTPEQAETILRAGIAH